MKLMLQQTRAVLRTALRQRSTRLLLGWAPLGIGLLMGGEFLPTRAPGRLPVAVWDQDRSADSRELLRDVAANQAFALTATVDSQEEGQDLLAGGRVRGFLVVPRGFALDLKRRRPTHLVFYQDFTYILPGRTLAKNLVKLEAFLQEKYLARTFTDLGLQRSAADFFATPLTVHYRKRFNPSLEYTRYLLPGILYAVLFQVLAVTGGLFFFSGDTLALEKPRWRWLASRIAAFLSLSLAPFLIVVGLLFPLFGLDTGSLPGLLAVYLPFALATLGLGLTLAALTRSPVLTTEIMIIVGAAGFTFSGFTWPRTMFLPVLAKAVAVLPLTSLLEESPKIWYGTGYAVSPLPLLGLAAAYFAAALAGLHWRRVPARSGDPA
jgi:ABC-2 type transport system permease protein